MKVRDLIAKLEACNPDAVVVLSRDSEGNGYSPVSSLSTDERFIPESRWSGRTVPEKNGKPDPDYYEDGDEWPADAVPSVTIWPTN